MKIEDLYPHIIQNRYACSIDLSKAYFHMPIHQKYQKFFTFQFNKIKYQWSSMPFGLSSAPYLFSIGRKRKVGGARAFEKACDWSRGCGLLETYTYQNLGGGASNHISHSRVSFYLTGNG